MWVLALVILPGLSPSPEVKKPPSCSGFFYRKRPPTRDIGARPCQDLFRRFGGFDANAAENLEGIFAVGAGELKDRRAVAIEADPVQARDDGVNSIRRRTRAVGVLDAQEELAAGVLGIKVIEQRRTNATDVQIAGGRRRKTGNDGHAGW